MTSLPDRFRSWYGAHVVENAAAQTVLLNTYKAGLRARAKARGVVGRLSGPRGVPTNVYYATIQKTGSHWFKAIFEDDRVRARSGLWSYPGHRYEWGEFIPEFPPRHFVPALFMPYGLYEEIRRPPDHRTFYVTRDPRDVVVSWYFSMRDTHRLVGKVPQHRAVLRACSQDEGLHYAIETLAYTFAFMRSWAYAAPRDEHVLMVRFEDATARPFESFRAIFDHCRIPIPDDELRAVLADYTKDAMRRLDDERPFWRQRSLSEGSHYRPSASSWRQAFTPEHHARFAAVNGDLLALLGYDAHVPA
jgi:hypothetical protein